MSEQYLGEIRSFAFGFAPKGWHACDGALLSIAKYQALFSILGTTYGGDGMTSFALPDLRGRVPVHVSQVIPLGGSGGEETHMLTINEMPSHTHIAQASSSIGTSQASTNNVWSNSGNVNSFSSNSNSMMSPNSLSTAGGSMAHSNMQPYTVINYCIAIQGIYPSRG